MQMIFPTTRLAPRAGIIPIILTVRIGCVANYVHLYGAIRISQTTIADVGKGRVPAEVVGLWFKFELAATQCWIPCLCTNRVTQRPLKPLAVSDDTDELWPCAEPRQIERSLVSSLQFKFQ
ncbi:MAG: hypothetical protein WBE90_24945, partial [Xanthobacteraceae bacterium]